MVSYHREVVMILREQYLAKLRMFREMDVIKVVTGIRRCGKSTLLEQFREELIQIGRAHV